MFFAMLLALAPAEANLATCAPREPPATGRCRYGFPAPSALQGCFLNLPTEAFDEAFSSSGLLTTEPCATVTTMPCLAPRPAVRRRRWRSTRPRTSSTSRRQRCAYLPPDLCPSASLTGAMPRSGAVLIGDAELRLQRRGRGLHARQRDAVLARRGHGLQGEPRPFSPPLPLSALPCAAPQRPPLSRAAPQATAMYLIRYAYKGSASLQLDAHTHQQEQDEIERLEGRA